MTFHCLFEQSGTFKNEFRKLGFNSFDYDISNSFEQTDFVIDLFTEIDNCYKNLPSIFDKFNSSEDFIFAFFPCTRFENQILLNFRGQNKAFKKWSLVDKLKYDIKLHNELNLFYSLITKLVIICLEKNLPLIIENPYSEQHYLIRYWCVKPTVIDLNRRKRGDFFVKPTQYFFFNFEPKYNFFMEPLDSVEFKNVNQLNGIKRSLISSQYANRFIREFII